MSQVQNNKSIMSQELKENLTNEEIIQKVIEWQEAEFIHDLTCFNSSKHQPLIPFEDESGIVKLMCLDCKYVQANIPKSILTVPDGLIATEKERIQVQADAQKKLMEDVQAKQNLNEH